MAWISQEHGSGAADANQAEGHESNLVARLASQKQTRKSTQVRNNDFLMNRGFLLLHFTLDTFLFYPEFFFGKLLRPITQEDSCVLENNELEKNYCEIRGEVSV